MTQHVAHRTSDEISRLRAENERLHGVISRQNWNEPEEVAKLRAENEQLTAENAGLLDQNERLVVGEMETLRDENERLRNTNDALSKNVGTWMNAAADWELNNKTLRAEIERLRKGLEKYGDHLPVCCSHSYDPGACDCGLNALQATTGGK